MPQGGMDALNNQDPLDILAYQYDRHVVVLHNRMHCTWQGISYDGKFTTVNGRLKRGKLTVSYTHLDVYKRQGSFRWQRTGTLCGAGTAEKRGIPLCI